eukprot:SAG11_NODE_34156_length_273_cov_1.068966_1_plen_60_part_01
MYHGCLCHGAWHLTDEVCLIQESSSRTLFYKIRGVHPSVVFCPCRTLLRQHKVEGTVIIA